MRRLFRPILLLIVTAFLLIPVVITHAQAGVTVTAQVQASLREGPGRQFKVLGSLPEGASAPASARSQDNAWIQATYNGITGWIAARQVTVTGNLNSLPVSGGTGGPAPAASGGSSSTVPTQPSPPANTRTLTLSERRVSHWFLYYFSDITAVAIQNGQLVITANGSVNSVPKVVTTYFNIGVANGKFVAAATSLTFDGGNHPVSEFTPDSIAKGNQITADGITGLFMAWEGDRTPVSVALNPGQMVITYAR